MSARTGQRIRPLASEGLSEEARALLRGHVARADRYLTGEPDAPPLPTILGVLGHHPRLAGAWLQFNGVLLDGALLDPRHRELLILRVAWLSGSDYEWEQHARIGQELGLTLDQIKAVSTGSPAEIWTPTERAVLRAAEEMIEQRVISDATWEGLACHFSERELLEVMFVVATYWGLALVLNNVDLQQAPDGVPVAEFTDMED